MIETYFTGMRLSLGLIAAIGAQNAFVLRQGLRREHVLPVVLFCAVSDAVLIAAGVSGFSATSDRLPWLQPLLLWGGIAFLVWYGARSLVSAWNGGGSLVAARDEGISLRAALLTLLAITWLNPHVYLDTVVFLGSIATRFPGQEAAFGMGAATGSFLFFATLGFGARALAPLFARPRAWQALDTVVGLTMWSIAWSLVPA